MAVAGSTAEPAAAVWPLHCCPQVLCTGAAVVAYYYPKPWTFPSLIVIGGLVTLVFKRKEVVKASARGNAHCLQPACLLADVTYYWSLLVSSAATFSAVQQVV